jgi:hypothetical protein
MGNYRFAERPLDPDAVAAADAAVEPYTGGRPLRTDETELRAKWMDAYEAAGGRVGTIEMDDSKPDDTCETCPKKKNLILKVIQLEFLSDHNLIKDNNTDWKGTGKAYKPPDWTSTVQNPITHSMGKKIKVKVVVEAAAQGSSEPGKLVGRLGGKALFVSKKVDFKPGKKTEVTIETEGKLKAKVMKAGLSIEWFVATKKSYLKWTSLGTTENDFYVTINTPRDPGQPEHAVTLKRMDKAVELVAPMDTTNPQSIVHGLMKLLPNYVLHPNKHVPPQFSHPDYFNSVGGAWPIADYMKYAAECQAIVRFTRKIVKQLGAPGEGKMVYIYAAPAAPLVAKEDQEGTPKPALHKYDGYALLDQPVTDDDIGKPLPPSHMRMPDGTVGIGFNAYEACLKFAAEDASFGKSGPKKTYYYPGGTGGSRTESIDDVLKHSFSALVKFTGVWYPNATDPDKVVGNMITEILADYTPYH